MEWIKTIMIVPALFLVGCGEPRPSYQEDYTRPYVTICNIRVCDLNHRVNDYIANGYTVSGGLLMYRGWRNGICQTLERMNNE